jgi:hypothetical protein
MDFMNSKKAIWAGWVTILTLSLLLVVNGPLLSCQLPEIPPPPDSKTNDNIPSLLDLVPGARLLPETPQSADKTPLPVKPNILEDPAKGGTTSTSFDPVPAAPLRIYGDADFMLWWVRNGPSPPLLTTAPNNGQNANGLTGGIMGQPGTRVLFDGNQLNYGTFTTGRAKIGFDFGPDDFWSVEAGGFILPKQNINFVRTSNANGTPLLTIPFIDAATGIGSALDVSAQTASAPGSPAQPYLYGTMAIHSDLQVWGYEANLFAHSIRTADRSIDLFIGFRSLELDENLRINQTVTPTQDGNITFQYPTVGQGVSNYLNVMANSPVYITDFFGTRNQFYGGQVGGRFLWDRGPFSLELLGKVAVGVTHQEVTINGSTTASAVDNPNGGAPLTNLTTQGGTFALQNNIGSYSQNVFTVVPEINLNLRYKVTSWMEIYVGYNALYWSNVARPGDQIDTVLNSKLIPTGALLSSVTTPPSPAGSFVVGQEQGRPYFVFQNSAFWGQGVNFGVELRY